MSRLLPGSVALIALGLSFPAMAADLEVGGPAYKAARPVVRAYDWTGFYVGGNVGGHWAFDRITTITDPGGGFGPDGAAAIDAASPAMLRPQGFIGGLQAGYNLASTGGVFGIEVDANWLGGSATRTLTLTNIPVVAPDAMTNTTQATFLSTLRMRWGTTVFSDRSLFFVTAGFAFETLKTTDSMGHFNNTVITSTSNSTTEPGLAAGGGFEYAFTDNLSAKVEYLYVGIKNINTTIPSSIGGSPDSIAVTHVHDENIGRFGLNFKFGG